MTSDQSDDKISSIANVPPEESNNRRRLALDRPLPWYRRPRYLVVLVTLVIAISASISVAVNRKPSPPGSATAKVTGGPNKTIADYLAANGIVQIPARPGEANVPSIDIPVPAGWSDVGDETAPGIYREMVYDFATNPDDAPFVDIILSRIDGAADPVRILDFAPGELQNLPDYRPVSEPNASQLSGFEAVQLAGIYSKDGEARIIAQKTVVIPSAYGLFVLQMNADGPKGEAAVVQQVTAQIDERTKIAP